MKTLKQDTSTESMLVKIKTDKQDNFIIAGVHRPLSTNCTDMNKTCSLIETTAWFHGFIALWQVGASTCQMLTGQLNSFKAIITNITSANDF